MSKISPILAAVHFLCFTCIINPFEVSQIQYKFVFEGTLHRRWILDKHEDLHFLTCSQKCSRNYECFGIALGRLKENIVDNKRSCYLLKNADESEQYCNVDDCDGEEVEIYKLLKPVTTTSTPTEEPITTVELAKTSTEEPITTTELATTSTEEPITTTELTTISTEEPITTTELTTTSTEEPITTTELATTSTEEHITTTELMTTSTKEPITTTELTTTSTEEPTTTKELATPSTEESITTTELTKTSTKEPITTTELTRTSTEEPTTITELATTSTEEPITTTELTTISTEESSTSVETTTSTSHDETKTEEDPECDGEEVIVKCSDHPERNVIVALEASSGNLKAHNATVTTDCTEPFAGRDIVSSQTVWRSMSKPNGCEENEVFAGMEFCVINKWKVKYELFRCKIILDRFLLKVDKNQQPVSTKDDPSKIRCPEGTFIVNLRVDLRDFTLNAKCGTLKMKTNPLF